MPADHIEDLEARRSRLYEQLAEVGDFRRGSVSENWRRCGKGNCACAEAGHPGHGPRMLWTRSLGRGKSRARQLRAEEVDKVRGELAEFHRFATLSEALVEVNEAICEARPPGAVPACKPVPDREKGGSATRSAPTSKPRSPPN